MKKLSTSVRPLHFQSEEEETDKTDKILHSTTSSSLAFHKKPISLLATARQRTKAAINRSTSTAPSSFSSTSSSATTVSPHLIYQKLISAQSKLTAKNAWNFDVLDTVGGILWGGEDAEQNPPKRSNIPRGTSQDEIEDKDENNDSLDEENDEEYEDVTTYRMPKSLEYLKIDFQKASVALDMSVKIFSTRVDDVFETSHRVRQSLERGWTGKKVRVNEEYEREEDEIEEESEENVVDDENYPRKRKLNQTSLSSHSSSSNLYVNEEPELDPYSFLYPTTSTSSTSSIITSNMIDKVENINSKMSFSDLQVDAQFNYVSRLLNEHHYNLQNFSQFRKKKKNEKEKSTSTSSFSNTSSSSKQSLLMAFHVSPLGPFLAIESDELSGAKVEDDYYSNKHKRIEIIPINNTFKKFGLEYDKINELKICPKFTYYRGLLSEKEKDETEKKKAKIEEKEKNLLEISNTDNIESSYNDENIDAGDIYFDTNYTEEDISPSKEKDSSSLFSPSTVINSEEHTPEYQKNLFNNEKIEINLFSSPTSSTVPSATLDSQKRTDYYPLFYVQSSNGNQLINHNLHNSRQLSTKKKKDLLLSPSSSLMKKFLEKNNDKDKEITTEDIDKDKDSTLPSSIQDNLEIKSTRTSTRNKKIINYMEDSDVDDDDHHHHNDDEQDEENYQEDEEIKKKNENSIDFSDNTQLVIEDLDKNKLSFSYTRVPEKKLGLNHNKILEFERDYSFFYEDEEEYDDVDSEDEQEKVEREGEMEIEEKIEEEMDIDQKKELLEDEEELYYSSINLIPLSESLLDCYYSSLLPSYPYNLGQNLFEEIKRKKEENESDEKKKLNSSSNTISSIFSTEFCSIKDLSRLFLFKKIIVNLNHKSLYSLSNFYLRDPRSSLKKSFEKFSSFYYRYEDLEDDDTEKNIDNQKIKEINEENFDIGIGYSFFSSSYLEEIHDKKNRMQDESIVFNDDVLNKNEELCQENQVSIEEIDKNTYDKKDPQTFLSLFSTYSPSINRIYQLLEGIQDTEDKYLHKHFQTELSISYSSPFSSSSQLATPSTSNFPRVSLTLDTNDYEDIISTPYNLSSYSTPVAQDSQNSKGILQGFKNWCVSLFSSDAKHTDENTQDSVIIDTQDLTNINDNQIDDNEKTSEKSEGSSSNNIEDSKEGDKEKNKIDLATIKYDKVSKQVNVLRLKKTLWSSLQNEMNSVHSSSNSSSTNQHPSITFSSTISNHQNKYIENNKEKINKSLTGVSLPYYFISLLHLANEKNLEIKNNNDFSDLYINMVDTRR